MSGLFLAAATLGLFASVAGLHHAGPRRTQVERLQQLPVARRMLLALSLAVAVGTFWITGEIVGWEVGITAWLGLVSLTGMASLFLAAVSQRWHVICGIGTAVSAVLLGTLGVASDLLS